MPLRYSCASLPWWQPACSGRPDPTQLFDAELQVPCVRQSPRQHGAAKPINHRSQIHAPIGQRNLRDIRMRLPSSCQDHPFLGQPIVACSTALFWGLDLACWYRRSTYLRETPAIRVALASGFRSQRPPPECLHTMRASSPAMRLHPPLIASVWSSARCSPDASLRVIVAISTLL